MDKGEPLENVVELDFIKIEEYSKRIRMLR